MALIVAVLASAHSAQAAPVNPWSAKTQWLSVRFGYAKSAAPGSADGNLGAGFGYTRFRNSKWAFGAQAEINVLGRFGNARELEVPWTFEVTRHYRWNTPLRPYLGIGAGTYYRKISGTGNDGATITGGGYGVVGANSAVADHGVLGLEIRMNVVPATFKTDPVFGDLAVSGDDPSRYVHWGVKLNYGWVF